MRTCTNCKGRIWPHEKYHVTKLGSHHQLCPESKVAPWHQLEWEKYVRLVSGMSLDTLCGKGPTPAAFISNLRMMADNMEKLLKP